jgi:hypothetical protein
MTINTKFNIGDTVYLKTDPEQLERIVYAIDIRQTGLLYSLCCGTNTSNHYDFEITTDKDVVKSITY